MGIRRNNDDRCEYLQAIPDAASPSASAPSQQAIPPTARFDVTLSDQTVATFDTQQQGNFKNSLYTFLNTQGISQDEANVALQNIRAGSVLFTTVISFLQSDATINGAASTLIATLARVSLLAVILIIPSHVCVCLG